MTAFLLLRVIHANRSKTWEKFLLPRNHPEKNNMEYAFQRNKSSTSTWNLQVDQLDIRPGQKIKAILH